MSVLHWHHTVPQALGGENSLQIPLCGDCHTVLHANADAIVAKIRRGTTIPKRFWRTEQMASRAQKWVGILVQSILNPPIEAENKEYKMQVSVPSDMHSALFILKQELPGAKTLQDAILFCISYALQAKGLSTNVKESQQHRDEGHRNAKKPKADLW